ncbi:MAG: hypothetical protein WCG47_30070 [Dermatophilaceae bacterium]
MIAAAFAPIIMMNPSEVPNPDGVAEGMENLVFATAVRQRGRGNERIVHMPS